jgi:hypothetical protein
MRVIKGVLALLIGLALIYIQVFQSKPALCVSPECFGFNMMWLLILSLGVYVTWRGVKVFLSPVAAATPSG